MPKDNNPLSPATANSPSSPGRKTTGIGGLIAGLKEVEERLDQLEGAHDSVENTVTDMETDVDKLKGQ